MKISIDSRFNKSNCSVLRGLSYLHPSKITQKDALIHIKNAAAWYKEDIKQYCLDLELQLIKNSILIKKITEEAILQNRKPQLIDFYQSLENEPECFPTITKLVRLALVLPVTSVTAERSFSKLKLIKNRLRSSMCQDCLQSLMLMSIESDIGKNLNIDDPIKRFNDKAPRRWDLY